MEQTSSNGKYKCVKKNVFDALNNDSDESDKEDDFIFDDGNKQKNKKTTNKNIVIVDEPDDKPTQPQQKYVVPNMEIDDTNNNWKTVNKKPQRSNKRNSRQNINNNIVNNIIDKSSLTSQDTGELITFSDTYQLWEHLSSNQSWTIDDCNHLLDIENVSHMWKFINNIHKMNFKNHDFILMRKGIYPLWEAKENKNGSKYSIRTDINTGFELASILVSHLCCDSLSSDDPLFVNGINMCVKNSWLLIKIMCKDKEDKIKTHLETTILSKFKNLSIWHQITEPQYDIK